MQRTSFLFHLPANLPPIHLSWLQAGSATVTATAPGLAAASLDVHVREPLFRSAWWCERAPEL